MFSLEKNNSICVKSLNDYFPSMTSFVFSYCMEPSVADFHPVVILGEFLWQIKLDG